jgi:hypothetical protein
MVRRLTKGAAVLAVLVATTAAASADGMTQLAAAAGLTPAQAEGMTLAEIHALKVNREARRDDMITVSSRQYPGLVTDENAGLVASAGLSADEARGMTLTTVAAYKNNRNASRDNRITVIEPRTAFFDAAAHPQLLAQAGLTADEAAGMSRTEVFQAKINREARRDDQQGPVD